MGSVVVLLKNYSFAAAASETILTPWVPFPAGFKNAQLVALVKGADAGGGPAVQLQTSWDTDQDVDVSTGLLPTGPPGFYVTEVSADLGPLVRLSLFFAVASSGVLTVLLTPKSEKGDGPMGPITLLRNFACNGAAMTSWVTDWFPFPAGFQRAQLVMVMKSAIPSGPPTSDVQCQLQTTWDTDLVEDVVGGSLSSGIPGIYIADISPPGGGFAGLGPLVRLRVESVVLSQAVISVYLTPKSS